MRPRSQPNLPQTAFTPGQRPLASGLIRPDEVTVITVDSLVRVRFHVRAIHCAERERRTGPPGHGAGLLVNVCTQPDMTWAQVTEPDST